MRISKTLMISAVLFLSATGAQAAGFSQQGNSLTVQLKQHQNQGPSQIRLQVVSDKIIRVQATAEQSFRNKHPSQEWYHQQHYDYEPRDDCLQDYV